MEIESNLKKKKYVSARKYGRLVVNMKIISQELAFFLPSEPGFY